VSGIAKSQVAGGALGGARHARSAGKRPFTAVGVVIVVTTALALALRVYYQSTRAGFLLGVTEYDDGPYFGSALRLAAGVLPYRDFVIVQPPGITLLLTPVALVAREIGTAHGMELARILTTAASGAGVVLAGLLVRRYGTLAVLITCGAMAVHPESIAAAHTVLVEPWLVLFCLIGALALFDGDGFARGRRLVWAGVAFGFGGAVEVWAIVPVVVAILLLLPRPAVPGEEPPGLVARLRGAPGRAGPFAAGVAAGFAVPVLPFVILAPRQFYDSVVVAQILRVTPARTAVWGRLADMLGIVNPTAGQETVVLVIAIVVAVAITAAAAAAWLVSHRPPPLLERFVVLTSALVIIMFCLADQFYYHFIAFLVPFLAASIALPVSRLLTAARPASDPPARPAQARRVMWWFTAGLSAVAIVFVAVTQFQAESVRAYVIGPAPRAIEYIIPPGACVLTDQVSMTILANRFYSDVPGCPQMVDGLATALALSNGKKPQDGAGYVPAVAAVWRQAFARAQIVLLSHNNTGRIAWTPALKAYFAANFIELKSPWKQVTLYKRKGYDLHKARAAAKHR
jgi:alpha-1,2-mannosyltransferase